MLALPSYMLDELGPGACGPSPLAETIFSARGSLSKMFTCKAESSPEGGHRIGTEWGWAPQLLPAARTGTRILLGEVSEASAQRTDTVTVWIICNAGLQSS